LLDKYSNSKFGQPCLCPIFNSKKMKNKFSLATLVAMGLMVISCSTDIEEMNTSSQNSKMS
jgi:hypothetical protein